MRDDYRQSNAEPATEQPPQPSSLQNDSAAVVERLNDVRNRLVKIGDHLYGSQMHDPEGGKTSQVEPIPAVQRNIDKALIAAAHIEDALLYIESHL